MPLFEIQNIQQKLLIVAMIFQLSGLQIDAMDARQKNSVFDWNDITTVQNSINEMFQRDQAARISFLQDRHNQALIEIIKVMDYDHTAKMKEIIAVHGWMSISKFGAPTDAQAWLLVQHADHDPIFQMDCLDLLQSLVVKQETSKQNYAYLYDRVALAQGNKQKYGTQCFVLDSGEVVLRPHEGTIHDLASHRKEVGLMPIENYLEQIRTARKK